jgi:hypothetical protein
MLISLAIFDFVEFLNRHQDDDLVPGWFRLGYALKN